MSTKGIVLQENVNFIIVAKIAVEYLSILNKMSFLSAEPKDLDFISRDLIHDVPIVIFMNYP